MSDSAIYEIVRRKLVAHGADRTGDGRQTLNDARLFALFVQLERAKAIASFDRTLEVVGDMETYLASLGKRHLIVFAYMYLHFSDLTPSTLKADVLLPEGKTQKTEIFDRSISDEERLIGLWASVRYDAVGDQFLRIVYANG